MYRQNIIPTLECLHKKTNDHPVNIHCYLTNLRQGLKKARFKFGILANAVSCNSICVLY